MTEGDKPLHKKISRGKEIKKTVKRIKPLHFFLNNLYRLFQVFLLVEEKLKILLINKPFVRRIHFFLQFDKF